MTIQEKKEFFGNLTLSDLAHWAGSDIMSRGIDYQHEGRVRKLDLGPNGNLVAWVVGTGQYATSVDVKDGHLISQCSCPYGERCKHAVAVVLQYAECVKNKQLLETVYENDERLIILKDAALETSLSTPESGRSYDELSSQIDTLSLEEIRAIMKSIVDLYPEARKYMTDRFLLSSGNVDKIVSATEREIYDLTSQPAWTNHWDHMEELPDYSEVRKRLEILLSSGHNEEVLRLGKTLLKHGTQQAEDSDDEGETEEEIASCMDIVFRALTLSSMSAADKMEWAVRAELEDEFDMTRGSKEFWLHHFEPSEWSALADALMTTLLNKGSMNLHSYSEGYQRDRLTDWIIKALENSNRNAESLSLCREEAEKTHRYARLVEKLINAGMHNEAEEWIRKGVDETVDSSPGTAEELRGLFQKIKEKEEDWLAFSSLVTEEYIERSQIETYGKLKKACDKVGVWSPVRQHILRFLETGILPGTKERPDDKIVVDAWPLPKTGLKPHSNRFVSRFPMYYELIEVAIYEKIPSEALRWYDLSLTNHTERLFEWRWTAEELRLARSVFGEFPDRAISIFKQLSESEIAQTNRKSYEIAVGHLAELGKLMQEKGRKQEWETYISELRLSNSRKPRFLKTLNTISGKKIMDL